jgi:NADH-quinone oxidoreductase subunit J
MLTRAPIGVSPDLDTRNRPAAAVAGLATAAALVVLVVDGLRSAYVDLPAVASGGSASVTGAALFRTWVLPFEVLSVLLLAALVGAIVLSRSPTGPQAPTGPGAPDVPGSTPMHPPSARFGGAG